MSSGQFRSSVWDPILLLCQILCMQCIFYFGLSLWVMVIDMLTGYPLNLNQLFNYEVSKCSKYRSYNLIMYAYLLIFTLVINLADI